MNSKFQIPTYSNASSNNSSFDKEEIHSTPTNSMIRKFLDVPKIMGYKNTIFSTAQIKTFTL
jgi:hypothetical protein